MDPLTLATLFQSGAGLLGGFLNARDVERARDDIRNFTSFQGQDFVGPFGVASAAANGTNSFRFGGQDQAFRDLLFGNSGQLLGGGLFNDPNLQAALDSNDIAGALEQFNRSTGVQVAPSVFNQNGGLFGRANNLASQFSNRVAAGPVDTTGGVQSNLFGSGLLNQSQSTDQSGLFNQFLNTQRNAAAPENNRQFNQLQDRLFAQGRLGTTGGSENLRAFFEAQNQQDLNFQNNAFSLANNQRDFLANLGTNQINTASGLLNTNLSQFNADAANALNFNSNALGIEGQSFNQLLQSITANQSAGQQRLSAAQGLFGLGTDTFANQFGLGLGGFDAFLGQNRFALDTILGLRNAEANRIGSTGLGSQALSQSASSGGGFGDFIGGLGGLFG